MRIAVVQLEVSGLGGAEISLDQVISRLRARHDFALFTFVFKPAEYRAINDIEKHIIAERRGAVGHFVKYQEFRRFVRLAEEIRRWRPDVVVLNKDFAYSSWLARSVGTALVWWLHGRIDLAINFDRGRGVAAEDSGNILLTPYRRAYDRRRLAAKDPGPVGLVFCVSRDLSDALLKRFPSLQTAVVPTGIDHGRFAPTWEDGNYVLSLCRFSREKNLDLLLDGLGGASYPVVVQGILGEGEGEKDSRRYMGHLMARAPDNVRIQLHTTNRDLVRLVQRCSLLVHPGHDEGFSHAILQAMSCGKVVVAHDSGGTPAALNGTGFLLADDPDQWRVIVDKLMSSPQVRKEMGERALAESLGYSWDRTANSIEEGLRRVVRGERRTVTVP